MLKFTIFLKPLTNKLIWNNNYKIENIQFSSHCPSQQDLVNYHTIIIEQGIECKNLKLGQTMIADPRDFGVKFNIINDQICIKYQQNKYPYPRNITDLSVENMSQKDFCQTWVTNPTSDF